RATLQRLGGAQSIVRTYLDGLMNGFNPAEQATCFLFFDRLVTPSRTKVAQTLDELATYAQRAPAEIAPLLKRLEAGRALRHLGGSARDRGAQCSFHSPS